MPKHGRLRVSRRAEPQPRRWERRQTEGPARRGRSARRGKRHHFADRDEELAAVPTPRRRRGDRRHRGMAAGAIVRRLAYTRDRATAIALRLSTHGIGHDRSSHPCLRRDARGVAMTTPRADPLRRDRRAAPRQHDRGDQDPPRVDAARPEDGKGPDRCLPARRGDVARSRCGRVVDEPQCARGQARGRADAVVERMRSASGFGLARAQDQIDTARFRDRPHGVAGRSPGEMPRSGAAAALDHRPRAGRLCPLFVLHARVHV